jgi:hypothetical protein
MFTLHGSTVNTSTNPSKVRLSCDIRFQPASHPVDKRHSADGRICRGIDERNRHPGPYRSLPEALLEWGCAVQPLGSAQGLLVGGSVSGAKL